MSLKILYGVEGKYTNVTGIAFKMLSTKPEFINEKKLVIPAGDLERAGIFGDPLQCVLKHIVVIKNGQKTIYPYTDIVNIDISDIDPMTISNHKIDKEKLNSFNDPEKKLGFIHQNLLLANGSFADEYPEQLLVCRYLPSNAHVLEIGANIGRNTLVIATLLDNDKNLVTLECNQHSAQLLNYNKHLNNYNFNVENAAISKRKLIQQGWMTIPSDVVLDGYTLVDTITFTELETKYNITFDTIVADCEGALYYILLDEPDILNNINLIIMENDYTDITHKNKVDEIMLSKGLKRKVHWIGGWGPCHDFFYEVWARD